MNEEVKGLWLNALRARDEESGKPMYEQGRGRLRDTDTTYCCLGVLCDLAANAGIGRWEPHGSSWFFAASGEKVMSYLPEAVAMWAGLDGYNPCPIGTEHTLADMNDDGRSFDDLADWVERGL